VSVGPAYVSSRGDVIPLPSLSADLGPRRPACLVLSPFLCLTAVFEVPPVSRHQLRSLVRYRLSTLFPGPPQAAAFGFVELTHSPTRHVLAFAMDREVATRLGKEHSGHVLLPAALLLRRAVAGNRWETAHLETPDATITLRLAAGASPELEVSPSEPSASLELRIPRAHASSIRPSLLARAFRGSLADARRLFREPGPSFAAARVLLPLAIATGAAWYHFADATRAREAALVALRQDHDSRQVAAKQTESRVKRVEELQK